MLADNTSILENGDDAEIGQHFENSFVNVKKWFMDNNVLIVKYAVKVTEPATYHLDNTENCISFLGVVTDQRLDHINCQLRLPNGVML